MRARSSTSTSDGRCPLRTEDLVRKVVDDRRGGFCFELNGLFASLLITLGYAVVLVAARHRLEDGSLGPAFDHARILVTVDGQQVVVDVGTGASPRGPVPLDGSVVELPGGSRHRVEGHVTLSDRTLITTRGGQRTEIEVDDPRQVLVDAFGVRIASWPAVNA